MCDFMLDSKGQEKELLKSLKVNQLFSVEILVEEIVVTHGPYKNSGDLDNITESESEGDSEGVTDGEGVEESLTVGMALVDTGSTCQSVKREPMPKCPPKIKKTCHKIPIDSWPPGLISSKAYVPPVDDYPSELLDQPFQLCKTCLEKCKDKKTDKIKKCECPKEICYRFPIDSWGPGITSASGIDRTKCVCTAQVGRPGSRKGGRPTSKDSKNKGKDGKGGKGGKDGKDGKDKKKGKGDKSKLKGDQGTGDEEEDPNLLNEEPKKPKKKNKRCKRPPKPEGPLPPIRVTISAFKMNDIKINQVDMDNLYPPEDENPDLGEESEPKIQVEEEPEVAIKKQKSKEKVKKEDAKKLSKTKEKAKGASSKASLKSSGSSKQSKNVIKPGKDKADAGKGKGGKFNLTPSNLPDISEDTDVSEEEDNSPLSKYKVLGGGDAPKCSGDLEAKLKEASRDRRHDYKQRQQVIESLRACTEFMRGVSLLFTSTPLDVIRWLLVDTLEIQVDRCAPYGPVYPIGKVKVRLPGILRDRVQAGARSNRMRALWSCIEDTFPIIDCKGQNVGDLKLYLCLTSLGKALVSTTLASETNLYQYTDTACYVGAAKPHRATAFTTRYNNLQRLTMKHFDTPPPPLLSINN